MNRLIRSGVAATLAAISVAAFSQGAPPNPDKTAIETRQGLFKLISNQSGAIRGALRAPTMDADAVALSAMRIKTLAGMAPELFARDTRQFKDAPTRALDGIWSSAADFKTKADGLASAADAVAAAAKSGDKAAVQKAADDMGKACGACHDSFRAK